MDEAGEIVEEVRVENANLDELAQQYAGSQAAIEATSNYYHMHDTLSDHLDVTVAHPKEPTQIANSDKKTDRVDAKELSRMVRLNLVPESYVRTPEIREARALVRGRQTLVENRTKYANKIHSLLSDHGITENVKPLGVKGREFLRELSLSTPWDTLLESYIADRDAYRRDSENREGNRRARWVSKRDPAADDDAWNKLLLSANYLC